MRAYDACWGMGCACGGEEGRGRGRMGSRGDFMRAEDGEGGGECVEERQRRMRIGSVSGRRLVEWRGVGCEATEHGGGYA